ncbi:MAG: hypothetical protein ACRDPC_11140 [Solirubrobacteraceae bacterium]
MPDLGTALGDRAGRTWCPHLAMLLGSPDEVHAALAAFYSLGASRNGWLFHRSLPGQGATDRAGLAGAGLDVTGLEAQARLSLDELPIDRPPESWAEPLLPMIDEHLARGFDAVWWSRFPLGAVGAGFELALRYDRAWDAALRGRRAVSLCLYIVEQPEAAGALAEVHDGLLRPAGDGFTLTRTR